ncbi:MAG: leucyl/phenylalanyl-tRNA--protein transferase [Bacteroidetes bacterium]|nr:leucyl/phenylalanyl-tRNA--protein transferase [Bacteroidota bacterium]
MPIHLLPENSIEFPNPGLADHRGILAVGGDLSTDRLIEAYRKGIFPWYSDGSPILWWSPDPRCVLFPEDLKIAKSMRPYLNQPKFEWTLDENFQEVIHLCGTSRPGTWITPEMEAAYCQLHALGYAHSVEVWEGDELVGGLYGIALGKCFFGESMFSKRSNASKFGFIRLVQRLSAKGYQLIDCQQETAHLRSMGATTIPRCKFLEILQKNETEETERGEWRVECKM